MAKRDDEIKEMMREEIKEIQLETFVKWNRIVCRTSAIAILGIATTIGSWIMNHSERAYQAMHVLIFGDLPK